jgi:hypothetical protein
MVSIRASPVVHWKVACTPVLDEARHKSGCGYTNLWEDTGVSRDTGNKNFQKRRLLPVG